MRRVYASLLLSAFGASLASAQARPNDLEPFTPRYTVAVGYAKVRSNAPPSNCNCFGADGGFGSVAYSFKYWLRAVGEVTGSRATDIGPLHQNLTLMTYSAGPQLVLHAGRVEPFVQVLFGAAHGSDSYFPTSTGVNTSATSFALSAGGGIDIGLSRHFGVRGQAEYLRTSLPNGTNDNTQNHLVAGGGLVFRFHAASWSREQKERQQAYELIRNPPRKTEPVAAAAPAPAPVVAAAASSSAPAADNTDDFATRVKSAYFDYDSYELRPEAKSSLEQAAEYLKAHPALEVIVGGYADERGTADYDLALGEKRAQAARDHLVANGISPDRLEVISYGKEKQVCSAENESCYQLNRRAGLEARR